ncbi:hypothetical protein [Paenibacillus ginsengarvi]|uniref:Uncharacterized protein n=1 Tax=Paenibacillus ginsengarvi TaxID=400777 RepID=A0A3B0BCR0_9BACL|nr:hypothetical protein [Paenibacillus ginsengarvi]RKN70550.1 hypothetical protein D7M11_30220 [Paenibacillus ginsengarvi]
MAVMIVLLWTSGLFGLWFHGMAFVANNTKQFTEKGHPVEGAYSFQVDLSSLESNIGKEIFNDGEHRIYVSWLQKTYNGGYDIGFRSSGQYSLAGATLISGVHHETINDHSFTMSSTAKLTAEYKGNLYNTQATGQCGLNYKDGDCFSFSFFLSDGANKENVESPGIVRLTITDLYQNIWRKK